MELAVLQLRRLLHLEVLDAPDLHASFLAAVLPRVLPRGLVHIGADAHAAGAIQGHAVAVPLLLDYCAER